ncbi:MAG: aminopeptidase N [Gammaproteobacteria bacterium]|nr:aminopeptidase N [Gammaproteobacteria bacterium]
MSESNTPSTIYRKDYTPYSHNVESVALHIELEGSRTTVRSTLRLRALGAGRTLRLDGSELELISVELDGRPLAADEYVLDEGSLTLDTPAQCELTITTAIKPAANTALEGLYLSSGNFCTQCEAEGFRRITFYPDRPDVLSVFTTTLIADRAKYPQLLANGNRIDCGELEGGRHYAVWHDPFPKPCYLFALVAGDLACVRDSFTTISGREVAIEFYVQHGNENKCDHAVASLKRAMQWDEEKYGREYDLDLYMVVAVDDFNMGAMENKGLNVFNSRFVLARPESATDTDFVNIEGVIGHEYFHNWSGNRVTCRDWFQLSLKEGFTVLRDQQFTADMTSAAVKRIDDVRLLRAHQFPEDAGPMAHPVRPDAYVEINNFYTVTVYEKGAEVVRMLHTLLGEAGFRKGADLYFARHDGSAVTCDDFVAAMEAANGVALTQFRRWYAQAGTPRLALSRHYDTANRRYTISLKQQTPPTPDQAEKLPLHIPLKLALLDANGNELPLRLAAEGAAPGTVRVLDVTEAEQQFVFEDIAAEPIPSLLRGFSAPVILEHDYSDSELAFLMGNETDPFNRWEAGQQLALRVMQRLLSDRREGRKLTLDAGLSAAFAKTLQDGQLDAALAAEALALPDEAYVAECESPAADPLAIHSVRQFLRRALAESHRDALKARYDTLNDHGDYRLDAAAMAHRRLKNLCLAYLSLLDGGAYAERQFAAAHNMTDAMAALDALVDNGHPHAEAALETFYDSWRHDMLVLDKWFSVQARSGMSDTLQRVEQLLRHPDFLLSNPNRVRSLIGAFAGGNPARFHDTSGGGYRLLADKVIELNARNPQLAARLLGPLTRWRGLTETYQQQMCAELQRIRGSGELSPDVYEVVSKSLV